MNVTVISSANLNSTTAQPNTPGGDLALPFDAASMTSEPIVPEDLHRGVVIDPDAMSNPAYAHLHDMAFALASQAVEKNPALKLGAVALETFSRLVAEEKERQRQVEQGASSMSYIGFTQKTAEPAATSDDVLSRLLAEAVNHDPKSNQHQRGQQTVDFSGLDLAVGSGMSSGWLGVDDLGPTPATAKFGVRLTTNDSQVLNFLASWLLIDSTSLDDAKRLTFVLDRRSGASAPVALESEEPARLAFGQVLNNGVDRDTVKMFDIAGATIVQDFGDLTFVIVFVLDL